MNRRIHRDMQQPRRRSKAERKESFADLPAVVEVHAEPAHQGEAKERRHSYKEIARDQKMTDTEGPHVSKVPEVKARRKSVGGEGRDKDKPGSSKDDEVSTGAKGRRSSESSGKIHQKKRRKSAPGSDVTGKTIAESTEKSDSTVKKMRRKSSTGQGPAGKVSMMKGQLTELPSGLSESGRRKSHQRDRKKSRDDVPEKTVADETEQSSPRKTKETRRKSSTAHGGKQEMSRRGSTKKSDTQESGSPDSKRGCSSVGIPRNGRETCSGRRFTLEDGVKSPPEDSGKSVLGTKSRVHAVPFGRRLSTKSASQQPAAALQKEDAPMSSDGLDSRPGSSEEANTKKTASLSSMISKSQSDEKKEGAESSASENKRGKQRSKGSTKSHATGSNREESAVTKEVTATTGK
ncbi:hypothetical protein MTO96_007455 [Rhipicephalus appendiculatus]